MENVTCSTRSASTAVALALPGNRQHPSTKLQPPQPLQHQLRRSGQEKNVEMSAVVVTAQKIAKQYPHLSLQLIPSKCILSRLFQAVIRTRVKVDLYARAYKFNLYARAYKSEFKIHFWVLLTPARLLLIFCLCGKFRVT